MPRHSSGQELVGLDVRAAGQLSDPFARQHEAVANQLLLELNRAPEKRCSLLWRWSFDFDGAQGYPQDCDDDESCADSIKLQTRRQRLPMLTMAILPGQTNQIGFCDPLPQQSPNSFNINAFRFV